MAQVMMRSEIARTTGRRASWLWLVLAVVLRGPIQAGGDPPARLDLETLRRALEAKAGDREPVQSLPSIELSGYSFHWQLNPGRNLRVVAVSYNLRGDLFVFDADGSPLARAEIGELTWLQLFDFDEDGTAELIAEEVDGRGTGVLVKSFRVYRLSSTTVEPLWQGVSYSQRDLGVDPQTGESRFELTRGYLRCEPSGGGRASPRLLHLQEILAPGAELRIIRQAYELEGGSFRTAPWTLSGRQPGLQ